MEVKRQPSRGGMGGKEKEGKEKGKKRERETKAKGASAVLTAALLGMVCRDKGGNGRG